MPKTEQRPHTVRFRTAEESSLAAMMAASAGVSTSEWVATAAREQMLRWLDDGYEHILDRDFVAAVRKDLQEKVDEAPTVHDSPVAQRGIALAPQRSMASRGSSNGQHAGL